MEHSQGDIIFLYENCSGKGFLFRDISLHDNIELYLLDKWLNKTSLGKYSRGVETSHKEKINNLAF